MSRLVHPWEDQERKIVTILFADVTGSTAIGDQLDPERVRALLSTYFAAMADVVETWGGTVEKFIGDAIMALFGVPTVREDDPTRALRAALEMQERLVTLNRDLSRDHDVALEIRIGVNTGEVVAPMSGDPTQRLVAGDAVNVAARLEQAAEPGTILVGERTHRATSGAFTFDPPIELSLKGKPEPVRAYRVRRAILDATRGIPGLRAPMVGRDPELAALLAGLQASVETGRPRLVIVYGPAGIGKSRLSAEFITAAQAEHPSLRVLRGRCLAAGRGITYWALAEILRGACGIGLDDASETVAERLRSGVADALGPLSLPEGELQQTVQALATTIGVDLGSDMAPVSADELGRAWPRFATGFAAHGPAIWLIEDLHWAGDPALEMIERIVTRATGPLVLLTTARPEFAETRPGFGAAGGAPPTAISLRPLTDQQGGQLVEQLLAVADLPPSLRSDILAKAEGNPFFVEEIVRRLIDEGGLVRDGDRWRATDAALKVTIPDTIHALLAARVDSLEPRERRVAQEAAVIGRVFWAAAISHALTDDGIPESLAILERRGLVVVRPTTSLSGQEEYAFRHALVRDVAYGSLPRARRARAHAEAGAWISKLAGDRTDEFAELVAVHYEAAIAGADADLAWLDDPAGREAVRAGAVQALLVAGRAMRRRYATTRAVELHERAADLATTDVERLDAWEQLGRDHDLAFHGELAVEAYQTAMEIARRDPGLAMRVAKLARRIGELVSLRSGSFIRVPDAAPIDALIREGLEAARDPRERAALLMAYADMAPNWAVRGDADPVGVDGRMAAAREAMKIATELDDPDLAYQTAVTLADLHRLRGAYAHAVGAIEDAMPLIERLRSPDQRATPLYQAADWLLYYTAAPQRALELAEQSGELARTMSAHDKMHATGIIIPAATRTGDWDRVEAALTEHLANFAEESGVRCLTVQTGPSLGAVVLAHRGDVARAREVARLPQPFDTQPGDIQASVADALVAIGDVQEGLTMARDALARAPRWRRLWAAEATIHALEALQEWDAIGQLVTELEDLRGASPHLDALLLRASGRSHLAAGHVEKAAAEIREALRAFEQMSDVFEAARTNEALADAQPAQKKELLESALATYRQLRATPHVDRVTTTLAGH